MNTPQDPEAAETVQTTSVPAVDLPRLVRPAPIDYKAECLYWKHIAKIQRESLEAWGVMGLWIPNAEQKPTGGKKVIVCGRYSNGNSWRAMATWHPKGTIDASVWDDPPNEWWNADEDKCTNPTGVWLEESVELEATGILQNVSHWMPMPDMPNDDKWLLDNFLPNKLL